MQLRNFKECTSKVEDYLERFERARLRVLVDNPYLKIKMTLGLREEIKHWVSAMAPSSVEESFQLAFLFSL